MGEEYCVERGRVEGEGVMVPTTTEEEEGGVEEGY